MNEETAAKAKSGPGAHSAHFGRRVSAGEGDLVWFDGAGVGRRMERSGPVIIKDTPKPFLQRLKEVALLCRAPVGVDYLVYTPDEFAQMIADHNPFILEEVLRKGKVLYEHQSASAVA